MNGCFVKREEGKETPSPTTSFWKNLQPLIVIRLRFDGFVYAGVSVAVGAKFDAQVSAEDTPGEETGWSFVPDKRFGERGVQDVRISGDCFHRCYCVSESIGEYL